MFSPFFCIFIFVVMVVEFVVMQSRATSLVRTNEMLNKRKIKTEEESYRCHEKIKVLTSNLKDKTAAIQKRDTVHKEFVRSLRKNSEMIESLIAEKTQLQKQLEEQDDALEELNSIKPIAVPMEGCNRARVIIKAQCLECLNIMEQVAPVSGDLDELEHRLDSALFMVARCGVRRSIWW